MGFFRARTLPLRLATGAYVAHAGWEKWDSEAGHAAGIHGMAVGAYPQLKDLSPTTFVRLLSAGEMATGVALLTPFVSNRLAGAALTGFAGALLGMYWRTPSLHRPGSPWPTQQGIGISKDVWMLAIGLALVADGS